MFRIPLVGRAPSGRNYRFASDGIRYVKKDPDRANGGRVEQGEQQALRGVLFMFGHSLTGIMLFNNPHGGLPLPGMKEFEPDEIRFVGSDKGNRIVELIHRNEGIDNCSEASGGSEIGDHYE